MIRELSGDKFSTMINAQWRRSNWILVKNKSNGCEKPEEYKLEYLMEIEINYL